VIRAHQPGSEPIDIPETIPNQTIPNPVVVPKPTPTPTEPAPTREPVRISHQGASSDRHLRSSKLTVPKF
jgi:hypothetical protein